MVIDKDNVNGNNTNSEVSDHNTDSHPIISNGSSGSSEQIVIKSESDLSPTSEDTNSDHNQNDEIINDSVNLEIQDVIKKIDECSNVMSRTTKQYTNAVLEREKWILKLKSLIKDRNMMLSTKQYWESLNGLDKDVAVPTVYPQKRSLVVNGNLSDSNDYGRHGKIKRVSEVYNEVQKRNNSAIRNRNCTINNNRISISNNMTTNNVINVTNPNLGNGSQVQTMPVQKDAFSNFSGASNYNHVTRNSNSSHPVLQNDQLRVSLSKSMKIKHTNDNHRSQTSNSVQNKANHNNLELICIPQTSNNSSQNTNTPISITAPTTISTSPSSVQSSGSENTSLLHNYLLQKRKNTNIQQMTSSNSPTLERLLTKPDQKRTNPYSNSKNFEVSIKTILSEGQANNQNDHKEVTITPLNRTLTKNIEESNYELIIDEAGSDESKINHTLDIDNPPICQSCNTSVAQFVCAGCSNQWYCSRECQVNAWEEHSDNCISK